jgi:transcription elongation factor Elf1
VRLAVLGSGLAALLALAVFSLPHAAQTPPPASESQRYLYCPQCRLEMTCPPDQEPGVAFCPHCGKDRIMEVNTFSRRNGESPPLSPTGKVLLAVAIGLPVALAVAVYLSGRQRTPEGAAIVFACPACGHKLRSQVLAPGSTAVCPACSEHFPVRAAAGASNRGPADALERHNKAGTKLASQVGGERPHIA